jgi:hypothetical protein
VLQSAFVFSNRTSRSIFVVVSFIRTCVAVLIFLSVGWIITPAQSQIRVDPPKDQPKKEEKQQPTPTPTPSKNASQNFTAEQIVESAIVVYAFPGGRPVLDQIRKTTFERGKTLVVNAEGKTESASYQKWVIRGASLGKEKLRLDQEFPGVRYSMIQNEEKIFGVFNDSVFAPREDASKSFQNQIYRGLDGFLRYKENESTIALAGKEKFLGVEYYMIDVTDKQARKTRYYVSVKRFRVMMLEYEEDGRKFRRKFYNYNYAQGTLVPYRTVLYEGDKVLEDTEIGTITFGQKVDESLFPPAAS